MRLTIKLEDGSDLIWDERHTTEERLNDCLEHVGGKITVYEYSSPNPEPRVRRGWLKGVERTDRDEREQVLNVLQEADRITDQGGERRTDYPTPFQEAERMALMIEAITGFPFKAEHWHLVMVGMKLMREGNRHKRDNLVDIGGYARCVEMFWDEKDVVDDVRKRIEEAA